jgi:hypothetical protein
VRQIKLWALTLAVVSVVGLAVTSGAQATEGPFLKINGGTLKEGETRALAATSKGTVALGSTGGGVQILCTGVHTEGYILQLKPNTPFKVYLWMHFLHCETIVAPEHCAVEKETIENGPITSIPGYSNASRTGPILELYEPETGKVFATVKFTSVEGVCKTPSIAVSGNVIAERFVGGKQLGVGEHEIETIKPEIRLTKGVKTIWLETTSKTLTTVKSKLEVAGFAAAIEGEFLTELSSGLPWGIFT